MLIKKPHRHHVNRVDEATAAIIAVVRSNRHGVRLDVERPQARVEIRKMSDLAQLLKLAAGRRVRCSRRTLAAGSCIPAYGALASFDPCLPVPTTSWPCNRSRPLF